MDLGWRLLLPKLERHFHRYFYRASTITAKKDMVQTSRSNPYELPGKLDRRRMAHPEIGDVGNAIELRPDSCIDCWMAMAVRVAPQRASPIQNGSAVDILQPTSLG